MKTWYYTVGQYSCVLLMALGYFSDTMKMIVFGGFMLSAFNYLVFERILRGEE